MAGSGYQQMTITLESIVRYLASRNMAFTVKGGNISVDKLAAIGENVNEAVCYYVGTDPHSLLGVRRSIVFCKPGVEADPDQGNTYIFTEHPQLCFYLISSLFEERSKVGISTHCVIDESAVIGKNVFIGPFCTIERCIIGDNVIIESNVKIHRGTVLSNNVHIQSNTVIGAIGVMWTWDRDGGMVRCAQTGNVIIEADVFIGSNVTISRGAFVNRPTIIGRNTMIAHGTTIGHGTVIGKFNHLANNVSLAGSVETGENCFFGSGSIARPHTKVPKSTVVGAGAVVVKDFLETGLTLIGNPARPIGKKKVKQSGVPSPFLS